MGKYGFYIYCALSGIAWSLVALTFGHRYFSRTIHIGVLASPVIGIAIGVLFSKIYEFTTFWRIVFSLLSLYLAAGLFALSISIYEIAAILPSGIHVGEKILEHVVTVFWGITISGLFIILWPLAYYNHFLLAQARGCADYCE